MSIDNQYYLLRWEIGLRKDFATESEANADVTFTSMSIVGLGPKVPFPERYIW